ncbi:hotdog domain-containing protein [Caulobacter sp. KR2-114]|jgi:acyl-coenzyme A thioesterase PaaI-like protein|uniref:hotdog domain-containing protein n=1 Tax=Caulobacter sp. KR2-114 TaxID=3400912 RepID=UPI003C0D56D9
MEHLAVLGACDLPTFRRVGLQAVRFDIETRRLSVSAHIGVEFAKGSGVLRGGIFAPLLDDVMTGAAILALGPETGARLITQSLDYFASAEPGVFAADAWMMSAGSHHCLMRAELRAPSGEIAALAHGVVARDPDGEGS